MNIRSLLSITAGLVLATTLSAQDTLRTSDSSVLRPEISFDFSAAQYYHGPSSDMTIVLPADMATRRPGQDRIQRGWRLEGDQATDNPTRHGSGFIKLKVNATVLPGVGARTELIGEHRGISYGLYPRNNILVFPRMLLYVDTSVRAFGEEFHITGNFGHFSDMRLLEGLTVYNMDGLGSDVELRWRKLGIRKHKIGDASQSIGLGLGDYDHLIVSLTALPIIQEWNLDASVAWVQQSDGFTGSIGLFPDDGSRVYAQLETRTNIFSARGLAAMSAGLVGARRRGSIGRLSYDVVAEYRRYGSMFNAGRMDVNVFYRDPERTGSANTTGPQLYPLELLERPFGQWAVFTEYQGQAVSGGTLRGTVDVGLFGGIGINVGFDLNYIIPSQGLAFLYPFYDVGIGWDPVRGTRVSVSWSNREMNLDKHYPTYYLLRTPAMYFNFRMNVKK